MTNKIELSELNTQPQENTAYDEAVAATITTANTLLDKLESIRRDARNNQYTKSQLINQMRACIGTALSVLSIQSSHLLPRNESSRISIFFERKLDQDKVDSVFGGVLKQHHLITQKASKALNIPIGARSSRRLEEILPYIEDKIKKQESLLAQKAESSTTPQYVSGISAAAA